VIVADDGSVDETVDLVTGHPDARVGLVRLPHRGSLGAVRNAGIAQARGELIAFLDSDDTWLPEKLAEQVEIFDRWPRVGLVCANATVIDEAGVELGRVYLSRTAPAKGGLLRELLADNFVIVSTAVVRRSLLERVGVFAEEPLLRGVEDYDLWLRVAAVSEVAYLPTPLARYREHSASMRREVSRVTYWRSLLRILERLSDFVDAQGQALPNGLLRSRIGACRIALAQALHAEGGLRQSLPSWVNVMRRYPYSTTRTLLTLFRS